MSTAVEWFDPPAVNAPQTFPPGTVVHAYSRTVPRSDGGAPAARALESQVVDESGVAAFQTLDPFEAYTFHAEVDGEPPLAAVADELAVASVVLGRRGDLAEHGVRRAAVAGPGWQQVVPARRAAQGTS